jgi:hypothetical protein
MKLRLDLMLPAMLIATAGIDLAMAETSLTSPGHASHACQSPAGVDPAARAAAEQRILAEGYSEISALTKGCDNAWRALALADGDPVTLLVTPQGTVLAE